MSELELDFQDTLTEIDAMAHMAAKFIAPCSQQVLARLKTSLENIRDTTTDTIHQWGIEDNFPLVTTTSYGSYQPNDEGYYNVFAEITSKWQVRRVRPPGKKTARATRFALAGIVSTRVRLIRELPEAQRGEQLAMWRMEAGDDAAPGCHFHVQVGGESDPPFPHLLDIPRLPSFLVTPPAVLDFVLGELHQKSWAQHASAQTPHLQRWTPIQRNRLAAVLAWQHEVVTKADGPPWLALKDEKPKTDLWTKPGSTQLAGR